MGMKIVHSFAECKKENIRPTAIVLGMFDGIHLGHQEVIRKGVEEGKKRQGTCLVLTFADHPKRGLADEVVPTQLLTERERIELLAALGVVYVLELPVRQDILRMAPEAFLQEIKETLQPKVMVGGENFTFGAKGKGTMKELQEWCEKEDIACFTVPLLTMKDGIPISSTVIRDYVREGKMEEAAKLLGRPFQMSGIVIEGDKRGRTIGFPTANVRIPPTYTTPTDGVYAARVHIGTQTWDGVANIGDNPTFANQYHRLEVYILDFDKPIYGEYIRIDLLHLVRTEEKFSSVEALIEQMQEDVKQAIAYLKTT